MSRFQTQEDILKLIDEEDDEFVDIPSGAESEDDEESGDEREGNGNDTHDSRATIMIPNVVINVPSRPSTPVIAGPSRPQRIRAQGRLVDVQQRSIPDVLDNELESSDSDNDGSYLRPQTSHQGVKWSKKEKPEPAQIFDKNFGPSQTVRGLTDHTPYKICSLLIGDDIIRNITFQTNLYAQQTGKRYTPTNETEIRTFIGINLLMGIKRQASYRDYWSSAPDLHDPYISKLISVSRFGWLLSYIHLNDNTLTPKRGDPNFDKPYKVRPFIDTLQKNVLKYYDPDEVMSADESMISFKSRSSLKQYMPKKPIRRGYKVWMLACKSAYVLEV